MSSSIVFILVYWSILTLPGLSLSMLANRSAWLNNHSSLYLGPLGWIASSYTVFVLLFCICNYLNVGADKFLSLVAAIVVASFILFVNLTIRRKKLSVSADSKVLISLIVLSGIYQLLVGSYNEVPADLYAHLERFQSALQSLTENTLGSSLPTAQLLQQKSGVFYFLPALATQLSDASSTQVVELVDFSNRTLFLIAAYCFARQIFQKNKYSIQIALATIGLISLHMGINVFSFIRYYSFAPTMLALTLYFCAIALGLNYLERQFQAKAILTHLAPILLLTIASAAVHTQEAMFIGIMSICLSIAAFFRTLSTANENTNRYQSLAFATLALILFAVLYSYSLENLNRAPNAHWRLWEFGEGFWFLPQLTTLNLKNQFIQVLTLWGVLVYVLFFLNIHRYKNKLFIMAGMLSPLLTFLNPFFIDTFLRHYNSTTVWRLCYLLPVHFVAADLFVHYVQRWRSVNLFSKVYSTTILAIMLLLLLPIANTWQGAHFSRASTLRTTDAELGYERYQDLITFLNSISEPKQILSDPMLGYMIAGLTQHEVLRRKFFRNHRFKRFSYYDYDSKQLDQYSEHLLITNTRQDSKSNVGRLSGHWSENEWINTNNYYPNALFQHLAERPNFFKVLWKANGIVVYQIAEAN